MAPKVQSPVVQDELSLDIKVVEDGDAVDALLCSTNNGCDTQKQGDCRPKEGCRAAALL